MLPLIAMCDRWDIGGLSTNVHFQTGPPTIFIYDGHPGGVGITLRGYEEFERLLGDAERLIGECPCEAGCPSCVQSPKCGNLNEPLHKGGALELMGMMLEEGRRRAGRPRAATALSAAAADLGDRRAPSGEAELLERRRGGRPRLAEAGAVLVCGGLERRDGGGLARGAREAGGA